jgi:hypothetical protein
MQSPNSKGLGGVNGRDAAATDEAAARRGLIHQDQCPSFDIRRRSAQFDGLLAAEEKRREPGAK